MKNSSNNPLHTLEESFFFSGARLETTREGYPRKIEHIIKRWNLLKKEEVLGDMHQILEFSRQFEVFSPKDKRIYGEMEYLLFTLREKKWGKLYTRVIEIIQKYLRGIERFLSGLKIREIHFYKNLFEGTMIAIIEEVKNLEVQSTRVFL